MRELEQEDEQRTSDEGEYALEFKQEAVRQVKAGRAASVVAKTLGMPKASLTNWVRADLKGELGKSADGKPAPVVTPEQAEIARLRAQVQEAYIKGISTRSVDDLVKALGMSGVSKSQVSRLCVELDEQVGAFLNRTLEGDWPYRWIDRPT